ncbi:hypothetical protein B0H17DRAFT_1143907 [Mycena rosella]|uniref:Uncharacterized protein n=1 Tax=Mycena rosella TaxID=1033263 RepID=A0AAD7G7M8_MYCRO|nr:hypothetical protein B0H17DRAFT_1143907 [Mycena rosella]
MQLTRLVYLAVILGASTLVTAAPSPENKVTIDITVHMGDMQAEYAEIGPISCNKNSECPVGYGCLVVSCSELGLNVYSGKCHEIGRATADPGYLGLSAQFIHCKRDRDCPSGYYCVFRKVCVQRSKDSEGCLMARA